MIALLSAISDANRWCQELYLLTDKTAWPIFTLLLENSFKVDAGDVQMIHDCQRENRILFLLPRIQTNLRACKQHVDVRDWNEGPNFRTKNKRQGRASLCSSSPQLLLQNIASDASYDWEKCLRVKIKIKITAHRKPVQHFRYGSPVQAPPFRKRMKRLQARKTAYLPLTPTRALLWLSLQSRPTVEARLLREVCS